MFRPCISLMSAGLTLLLAGCQSVPAPVAEMASAAELPADRVSRLAIATAYSPEFAALIPALEDAREYRVNGVSYWTGSMRGQEVVLFETGVSLINAAMNTERLFDHFSISGIIVSGVAGGVDPDLTIGDVTVPRRWAQYNETIYLREAEDGSYSTHIPSEFERFDFMVPRGVRIARDDDPNPDRSVWFPSSPDLLSLAESAAEWAELKQCDEAGLCLPHDPEVIVGGSGVSGSVFMDNARFREYLHDQFEAEVVEMETAAIAMVAYSHDIPFIAFRSLSDLAGGGQAEQNEIEAFQHLAAVNSAELVFAFLDVYGEANAPGAVDMPSGPYCEINFSISSTYAHGALGDDLVAWLRARFESEAAEQAFLASKAPLALEIAEMIDPALDAEVMPVWGGYKGRTSPSLAMRFPVASEEDRETAVLIASAFGYAFTQESVIAQCDDFPGDAGSVASIDLTETGAGNVLSVDTLKPVFGMMLGQADGNFDLGYTYYPEEDRFSTLGFTDGGAFERSAMMTVKDDLQRFTGDPTGLMLSETSKWVEFPFNDWREYTEGEAYLEHPGMDGLKGKLDAIRSGIIAELQADFAASQE